VPKMFEAPEDFRRRLASSTHYHVLNVEPRSPVRLPQPMRPADLPGREGEDLISCLFSMREAERCRFEAVEDALRTAFPDFERLDLPPVAAGTLAMTWRDRRFPKPFYMHQLSEVCCGSCGLPRFCQPRAHHCDVDRRARGKPAP
jgi:predicted ATPase